MDWGRARKSNRVLYQSEVHRVKPKQSYKSAWESQARSAKRMVDEGRIDGKDKEAQRLYEQRKRVRLGDDPYRLGKDR